MFKVCTVKAKKRLGGHDKICTIVILYLSLSAEWFDCSVFSVT